MKIIFVDIETPSIPKSNILSEIKQIHCIALKINDEPTKCYTFTNRSHITQSDGTLRQAKEILDTADLIIGHNILKFDIPVIENHLGKLKCQNFIDTLIISKLMYSRDELRQLDFQLNLKSIKNLYALESWGKRLGTYKINYNQFDYLTDEMIIYCKQDVEVTANLYHRLKSNANYPQQHIIDCEQTVAQIIAMQQEYGVWFDIDKALILKAEYENKIDENNLKLQKIFPPKVIKLQDKKPIRKLEYFKLNPKIYPLFNSAWLKYNFKLNKQGKVLKKDLKVFKNKPLLPMPYRTIYVQPTKTIELNPNSRQQLCQRLIEKFNWTPYAYTEKGNVVLNADILSNEYEESENEEL